MNAIDHSWYVFPVIDICCFWIKYLENKRNDVFIVLLLTIILSLLNYHTLIVLAVLYLLKDRETVFKAGCAPRVGSSSVSLPKV